MDGHKKAPAATEAQKNTFNDTDYTTPASGCNTAFTGSAATYCARHHLMLECIDNHGGTATLAQIIAAFRHAGFRPQQARDTVTDGTVARDVAVRTEGMELVVSRISDPDSIDLRKRLVEVQV